MTVSDYIQLASVLCVFLTLILLLWEAILQNRLLRAQLFRDRLELYLKTYEPVTDEQVRDFHLCPQDYMPLSLYESDYKDNDTAARRYIAMSYTYEYLAFTFLLKKMHIPDPLGHQFTRHWATELVSVKEFRDVHESYRGYYPDFERFVDDLLQRRISNT